MMMNRRKYLKVMSAVPTSALAYAAVGDEAFAATGSNFIGTNSGYALSDYKLFTGWFGRVPNFTMLCFNLALTGADLTKSIAYISSLGASMYQLGSSVIWSVPFPGPRQIENVNSGQFDDLYTSVFKSILANAPAGGAPIYARLPWEFNVTTDNWHCAAVDSNGLPSPTKFVAAWIRIANIARSVSPRFQRIWCPNVCTRQIDPLSCWPGAQYVEIVSQDIYMRSSSLAPSALSTWLMPEPRGLTWGANFAASQNKPYALTELGFDSDVFAPSLELIGLWLKGLGSRLHHVCWWDRTTDINCKLSDGQHATLGATFKGQFA